jgi:hypothetical protein
MGSTSPRRRSSTAQQARSRLASAHRRHDDPEKIDEARRDLAAANIEAYVRKVVDAAPPLTPEQRDRLALLFGPGQHDGKAAS